MRRTHRKPKNQEPQKTFRINRAIHAPIVMLIDDEGTFRGEMPVADAIALAEENELDLVEVNPTANPPIVKIADYGQFKYEREKKAQKQKVQLRKSEIKGLRLSIRIGDHDLNVRSEQAKKFLSKGDKLRLELQLRGRERQHPELARQMVDKFLGILRADPEFSIVVEEGLTSQGGKFTMVVINKKS
ncbi:MAG: translation initiation factor IF-3 [Candidatus Falkowbacteria bacterium]|nr:translation initiation factor IF-3 [Candidatus Falkowbacteria bacterium]